MHDVQMSSLVDADIGSGQDNDDKNDFGSRRSSVESSASVDSDSSTASSRGSRMGAHKKRRNTEDAIVSGNLSIEGFEMVVLGIANAETHAV